MKKLMLIAVGLALVALPASAGAKQATAAKKKASAECRAERDAAGAENFRTLYRSFGQCVRLTVRENRAARAEGRAAEARAEDQAELNAARECRAERDEIGDEPFAEQYGTNHNKRNAFGKCVSGRVAQEETEEPEAETKPDDGEETESDDGDEETQPETGEEETQPDDGEETPDDDTVEDVA